MGSPVPVESPVLDPASFLLAAREILTLPSDAAVGSFLRSFPLPTLLAALQAPSGEGAGEGSSSAAQLSSTALACLECVARSDVGAPALFEFLPAVEQGLNSPVEEIQRVSCLAVQRVGELAGKESKGKEGKTTPGQLEQDKSSSGSSSALSAADRVLHSPSLLHSLLLCLSHPSTSLGTIASNAVTALCSSSPKALPLFLSHPQTLSLLKALIANPPTTTQQRAIALATRLACIGEAGAEAVRGLGAVEVLLDMIGGERYCNAAEAALKQAQGAPAVDLSAVGPPDELAALTACELLSNFTNHPNSARVLASHPHVAGSLLLLLRRTADPFHPSPLLLTAPLLVRGAWKAAASLISPPSPSIPSPVFLQHALEFAKCLAGICSYLIRDSDPRGPDAEMTEFFGAPLADQGAGRASADDADTTAWEEAVLEAASIMNRTVKGASLLLLPETKGVVHFVARGAFSALPHKHAMSDLQVAALHSLASVLGSERGEDSHYHHDPLGFSVVPLLSEPEVAAPPENLELGVEAEAALRECLYYAAVHARGGPAVGSVLLSVLKQEEAVREAAYRLITVLVERTWGITEVCGWSSVVDCLCDPLAESNKEAMDWRHTAVVAAATAAANHAAATEKAEGGQYATRIPPEVLSKLEGAAKLGPYAVRRMVEAIPTVAVEERPPMGT